MPVAVQADKRFHRARTRPVRRRLWQRPWARVLRDVTVGIAVLYLGYRGVTAATHTPLLSIRRIVVQGNERLSTGEVDTILAGLEGRNILDADLSTWRRRLLDSAWVQDATLRRALPSTVEVQIVERQPIGIARLGDDLYLVDADGTIIDAYGPNYGDLDLPIIDGLGGTAEEGSVDASRAALAADLLAAVRSRPELARRISQIDVSDVRDAVVILSGDPARLELGERDFLQRLQSYLEMAPTLKGQVGAIDYVDLRFAPRIYVRPVAAPKGSKARTADGPRP
ncbi:MAG: FtsQ-type POTRA domain-containing protein [Acidobacteriota bacterium]|nr:FtsQ-type POTRA domain-containing protein [Acidobacteriota bacterium]